MTISRWILFLMLIIGITSCSHLTPPPATSEVKIPWKDRQTTLNSIHSFKIDGKIAVQTTRDSGSASVNWVQKGNQFNISLLGPLGSNGLKLTGQPGRVSLQTSDGKTYSANSPEQLLAERWGFHLPVSNLNYWVRGLPVPGPAANTQFDNYGRLTQLVQQGWNIQYQSYMRIGKIELPERIYVSSPSLKVKMVIYQWNIG